MAPSRFPSFRGRPARSQSESQAQQARKLQPRHIPAPASGSAEPPKPPRASTSSTSSTPHLIALRYEQTVQAKPPIPIPPPRNPLRTNRPAAAAPPTDEAAPALQLLAPTTKDDTRTPQLPRKQSYIVVPPPSIAPSQTQLKTEQHPALRPAHSPASSSTTYTDWKRDSALGTLSSASTFTSASASTSASTTVPDEIEVDSFSANSRSSNSEFEPADKPVSICSAVTADGPTQPPSTHWRYTHSQHQQCQLQSRWSFSESDVDVSETESLQLKLSSSNRLIKGLSLRLAAPKPRSKPKPKRNNNSSNNKTHIVNNKVTRYSKNSPGEAAAEAMRAATLAVDPAPTSTAPHQQQPHQQAQQPQPSVRSAQPQSTTTPGPHGITASQEIGYNDSQSPTSSRPVPGPASASSPAPGPLLFSSSTASFDNATSHAPPPTINTDIPVGSFLDDADLDSLHFSNRGSIYFGGRRAISAPTHSAAAVPRAPTSTKFTEPRAAPPVPASPTHAVVPGGSSPITMSASTDAKSGRSRTSVPPDIRVMLSDDTERESQKVRSLYESADSIHLEDAIPGRLSGEPLEPPQEEAPSDGDDNFADPGRKEKRKSVRAMYLSPTSPLSATSLPSPRGNRRRHNEFELAGGIEDWEDVQGEDVDRYGFITPESKRPVSRASVPGDTRFLSTTPGRRNGRNVLAKRSRGPPLSQGLSRIPSRKVSARSLNTQASAMSASSRVSVRSGIRTAANMLPHNRDRRIIDAAGDMLSLPPGLADIDEEQRTLQAIKAAQDKESRRAEKWRKMAKIVTKGTDGKGTKFAANNVKKELGIKFETEDLAKKKAKDVANDSKLHFQIQSVDVEFDTTHPKLVERTWKGIPDRWRASAWYSFLATSARQAQDEVTDDFLFAKFHSLQEVSSPDDLQIDLDVPRTINRHIMFRKRYRGGQRLLFRVLHAVSLYFPETGYVQGMAALAASLLCYYDEERCFVMLVRLWLFRGLERLYQQGFAGLMIALQDLEKRWLHSKPIAQKLNELCIDPTAYGTRWYLTLFNLSIPFPLQLRVWDVFMLLGGAPPASGQSAGKDKSKEKDKSKAKETDAELVFDGLDVLHATATSLIDMHKDVIIGGDFENVMKGLTSFQEVKDVDRFMNLVRAEWNVHRVKKRS